MMRAMVVIAASLLAASAGQAGPAHPGPRPGDTYELRLERESSSEDSAGSTGSSSDRSQLLEKVIAVRADGVELEYDLPAEADVQERAREWQFPARIFRPHEGPLQLLNRAELEARVELWLKKADRTRAACGQWYFTWNAFQVQCDPQSVIDTIEAFDPGHSELRDGGPYRSDKALAPAPLARTSAGPDGATFVAELQLDSDVARRDRAQADVVVGQIMREPVTVEEALRARAGEAISGTIRVTLDVDAAGMVRRRTTLAKLQVKSADGGTETRTVREILERRLVSGPGS